MNTIAAVNGDGGGDTVPGAVRGAARPGGRTTGEAVRFVALGDSLTEGIGDPIADGWRGWAALLARSLAPPQTGVEFTNLARSGALTTDLTAEQLPAALALRPQFAAVVAGGNDTLRSGFDVERTTLALDTVLGRLTDSGAVVLTACLPDPGTLLRLPGPLARPLARRMRAVNTVVHALAVRHHAVHLHLAELPWTAERRLLSVDRLHPSAEGHHLIARGFHELLATTDHPLGPAPAPAPAEPPPGTLADLWWMATRGTRWVLDRSTDLLPGLLALAAVEGCARLRGTTDRQDHRMTRATTTALAALPGPPGQQPPRVDPLPPSASV
ncbi:SGNH/GDSL hydrolase family protein [Kitasatospora purpeofusca]|uniref:SGNH/GDSL hydrolase family protein n=1 Tax=Kitasatospora purpeofusca TaxID=67352 RepID=UPI003814A272